MLARAVSTPGVLSARAAAGAVVARAVDVGAGTVRAPDGRGRQRDVQATLLPALSAATEVECWLDIVEQWDHYEEPAAGRC